MRMVRDIKHASSSHLTTSCGLVAVVLPTATHTMQINHPDPLLRLGMAVINPVRTYSLATPSYQQQGPPYPPFRAWMHARARARDRGQNIMKVIFGLASIDFG